MRYPALVSVPLLLLAPSLCPAQTAFQPGGNTVTLSVTGTTARVQVQPAGAGQQNVRVYNSGTVAVFLSCGDVAVTAATATSMPIAPGTVEVIGCGQQYVAGISAGTAATVYLTAGSGI
jgi:hypothetical protein